MSLQVSVIFSVFLSLAVFGSINHKLNKERLVRYSVIWLTFVGASLNITASLLHELAHALTAELWGLKVTWGGSLGGQYIITTPMIYDTTPLVQMTVALSGPLLSLLIVAILWQILNHTGNAAATVVLTYLLFVQGLGSFGSLLMIFSGDARNFAQGVSKFFAIPIEHVGYVLVVVSFLWILAVTKRCMKSVDILKTGNLT
ncbi:MAG: hypothetical protein UU77_C0001G0036 [candidate division WWE3 bacterium GW2011_GWC1_41_7]|uniref:Uncharacterized protein n=3 Tax=Katanobacteria TaxID=422282 RepID=A0A0G0ZHJ8_UNCKA|nr:MAG: hypothetical protein UU72_C0003G0037 [candidate division WWE3 bacterium GW2011_GWB1_41_6]KKS21541.1 MAG: hypothetical protein UU77_C0001G0036 [candidate division WWE3 bacterium GW2011_GWC1_41_7]KKS22501.1 MAG: hypothetical protein UU80_C0006G0027 [candidate division WWE3 bacterium GW2011_GWA1_41_8]